MAKRKKAPAKSPKKPNKILLVAVPIALILLVIAAIKLLPGRAVPQIEALREYVLSSVGANELLAQSGREDFVVFLSLCDAEERARVVKGVGGSLEAAWDKAEKNASKLIAAQKMKLVWAKADIVNHCEEIPTVDLNNELVSARYSYFFRKGIAFDKAFDVAYLEGEINGNKLINYYTDSQIAAGEIDYDAIVLNLKNINAYRRTYYALEALTKIPDTITLFTTIAYFCGEDGKVHELYSDGPDAGRRVVGLVDASAATAIIDAASNYLYGMLGPDGKFIYGIFPIFDNEINNYNILRHTGSIWSLINYYRMTGDESLVPKLDSAIDYLVEGFIDYRGSDTAFVVERKTDEIKLGGNGLAVIMLSEYMDVFQTDKYLELVRLLANGILELENDDGSYYHVLNYPDYSPKEEFRTIYYDGEATFALTRAYTFTGERKYLDGAAKAVDYFIANDYTVYRDHWVAYSLNEITQYLPEPRYFEFALQNVSNNLKTIYSRLTLHPTYLELLMAGWETYERLLESGIELEYLETFDVQYFAETIYKRVFHLLNGFFYPEYAMYVKAPGKAVNAFYIRNDNYRIRIDDIQHFIGGYYKYTLHYDSLRPYLSPGFLAAVNGPVLYDGYEDEADMEE